MDRLNGSDLTAMFTAGAIALRRNVDAINALNVYPVIDGDTGTNMYLTMQSGVDDVTALKTPTVSVVASAMYSRTFKTPGGNSGRILSQFLKGFADGLQGNVDCGVEDFARSCQLARENAYKAVADPVEGTMLTVITSVAEAAREAADAGRDLQLTLQLISDRARETVARTTEMLPVLQEAGVVDSGGQGLAVALEGFRRSVTNEDPDDDNYNIETPEGALSTSAQVSEEFLAVHAGDLYGYCTQFLVEVDRLDVDELRERVSSIADSAVVIADESSASVHGHTKDPGHLVSLGVSLGLMSKLSEVKIENMDAQRDEFFSSRGMDVQTEEADTDMGQSVVAVAWGYGIERLFRQEGAIVTGGNTMNPSVRDLLAAVDRSPSDIVYLLPNNKNIVSTAKQAAERSSKNVHVVETVSIPQGIVALFNFKPDAGQDETLESMEAAKEEVVTAEVTRSVRDSTMDGIPVREGQYIGLLDGSLVATGDDLQETLLDLIGQAEVTDYTHIRLFQGVMVSKSDADDCVKAIQNVYDALETPEVVYGGQSHYEFIISIE